MENHRRGSNLVVLGGDFNLVLNLLEEEETYSQILDFGFIDTYSFSHGCYSCCSEEEGFLGCTYAGAGNPYSRIYSSMQKPQRLDYIFVKGIENDVGLLIFDATVVFDFEPWVSDHSDVLIMIRPPGNDPSFLGTVC